MRVFFHFVKAAAVTAVAAACALFACVLRSAPAFEMGEYYEFYLGASSSSLVLPSENPARDKLFLRTAGESVRYEGNRWEELKIRYRAEVLFTEEAGGVINYYCYSPCFTKSVRIDGYVVNFHVAVSAERTAAGTPLVFGGF
ncbi:MAG: hypothetical protein ACI4ST_05270 [Candidatus Gallimonas sp.]